MSTNKTQNYQLNQWVKSDQVRMEDFNADNAKIDAALASKASTSALSSLQSSLSSQIGSLQSTVSGQGTALAQRNCCVVTGSYVGDGTSGESSVVTLSFSRKPLFIQVNSSADVRAFCAVRGQDRAAYALSNMANPLALTWGAKSVSWHAVELYTALTAETHLNDANTTYYYFAVLEL